MDYLYEPFSVHKISNLKSQISNLSAMTFEEFFRKKKIDLAALGKAEPALFAEFKSHYEQMGEKSFDHTKKYWFNKLRLIYHLAPEVKEQKVIIENTLAEQTITDTLEERTETPNMGFKPRFKAGMTAKPAEPKEETKAPEAEKTEEAPATTPKPGFTPRFKAGVTKPVESAEPKEESKAEPSTPTPPKPGFTPRFKAGVTKPAAPEPEPKEEPKGESAPETPLEEKPAEDTASKPPVGFKPRFNAKNIKPKE